MNKTPQVHAENIFFNGKHIPKKLEQKFLLRMQEIDKNRIGQSYGFNDYAFNRGITGWKPERTMRLGLEIQKYLYKAQAEETAPHISIDFITYDGKRGCFYRGPDLVISEEAQSVKITGIAHLSPQQLNQFTTEEEVDIYNMILFTYSNR